jgi:hypothetical protein
MASALSSRAGMELVRRVDAGTLVLTLTGGAIRAHTTLLTKQLQVRFGVHVGFNELVADPTLNPGRLAGALGVLEGAVAAAETTVRRAGLDPGRAPLHAVVKVQPYHVTAAERGALFRLARNNVFSIRDPVRTMESILRGMLEITHLRAVRGDVASPRLEDVTEPGADLSHVRGRGWAPGAPPVVQLDVGGVSRRVELDPFGQHVRHVMRRRDYASLGSGFARYFSYYPVLDGPDLKLDLWRRVRRELGEPTADRAAAAAGFAGWDAMVAALALTPSTDFDRLPPALAAPLRFRRTGWAALAEALSVAAAAAEDYVVLDSLDLLAHPGPVLASLGRRFGLPHRLARPPVPYARFTPGFEGLPIRTALFRRVAREHGVAPPRPRPPLPPSRFPAFVRDEIVSSYRVHLAALAGARRLRVPGSLASIAPTQPTGIYARLVADGSPAEAGRRDAIRRAHPELERWFDAIDAAA